MFSLLADSRCISVLYGLLAGRASESTQQKDGTSLMRCGSAMPLIAPPDSNVRTPRGLAPRGT